ncbi:hypothetical protein KFU94_70100 [Chloroflexi bacterium TSY]|nr:hypothetical protein [Chloroflexi bacterium TSY]
MMQKRKKKLSSVAIFLALIMALAACGAPVPGGGDAADADTAADADAGNAMADSGEKTIIIGTLGEAQTLNPLIANETEGTWRAMMMFEPLLQLDAETFEPFGRLATSWDVSDDGLTYTFTLRDDVKWHDGEPTTADDVAFTVYQILDPDYTGPHYSDWASLLGAEEVRAGDATEAEGIQVIDDYTIAFTLKEVNAPFLVNTIASNPFIPVPEHILTDGAMSMEDFGVAPVGNGPYKFVSWEIGNVFEMEANPDYHGEVPKITRVIHRNIPDSQTLVIALEAGEIDSSLYALPTVADSLREKENLEVLVVPFNVPNGFKYNLEHPVLGDPAIRKAIAHAVDNETYASEFLLGLGAPGNWAYNAELEPYAYDPELSAQILADAGWVDTDGDGIVEKDGVAASVIAETNAGNVMREDYCTYQQAALLAIGIDWQCEFKEWSVIVNNASSGNFEAIQPQWAGATVEPDELFQAFHSTGSNNMGSYSNPEVDALLEQGRTTVDVDERKEIYDQIQAIIHDEQPVSYDWYRPFISVVDKKFDGPWLKPSMLTGGLYRSLYEWDMNQ